MRHPSFRPAAIAAALIVWWAALSGAAPLSAGGAPEEVLARVEVVGLLEELGLPVHAHLMGADGRDYALVIAQPEALAAAGWPITVLHRVPEPAGPRRYLTALERLDGARALAAQVLPVLWDDGRQIVAWATPAEAARLAELGFEIAWLPEEAMVLAEPSAALFELSADYDPAVAEQIAKVTSGEVAALCGALSGETAVKIGGVDYHIETRNTNNTVWQARATQYAYEYFAALGLEVAYHVWQSPKRNVVAEKPGTTRPDEIVLVTAHLDDMPASGRAPGADDNASGATAVMLAAKIMKDHAFARTLRFVLFTGEEQGLLGSYPYAKKVAADGDHIVAVLNMDMIAWDQKGGPVLRLHTRTASNPGHPGDRAIAELFIDVVGLYGLGAALKPVIDADGISASDHASFWGRGFSAILAIEDDADDFNAYYHTAQDRLDKLNLPYFTGFVKAALGTAAHLAGTGADAGLVEIVSVSTGRKYALGLAQVGSKPYIDRTYTIKKIGAGLAGGALVQTANDDKKVAAASHLKLKALKDIVLYAAYDKRGQAKPPTWLAAWQPTIETLETTDADASPMKVFKKSFAAGAEVTLGGNLQGGDNGARSNYFLVARPLETTLVDILSVSTGKAYALTAAKPGAKAYIDRDYTVTALSAGLAGGVLVQTANDDKKVAAASHLALKANRAATIYVAYDRRATKLPAWLAAGWTATAESLGTTDSGASPLKVYQKTVAAGAQITLGGNMAAGAAGAESHYLVVVTP
jgi:hypothetical protein